MIVEFLRSDGIGFSAEEGSPAFELMEKDGAFTRVGLDLDAAAEDEEPKKKTLSQMNKSELYVEAATREVSVTEEMTKKEIIAAIEAKDETETETEKDLVE